MYLQNFERSASCWPARSLSQCLFLIKVINNTFRFILLKQITCHPKHSTQHFPKYYYNLHYLWQKLSVLVNLHHCKTTQYSIYYHTTSRQSQISLWWKYVNGVMTDILSKSLVSTLKIIVLRKWCKMVYLAVLFCFSVI